MSTDIKEAVREKYGQVALRVLDEGASCCGSSCCGNEGDPITSGLYDESQSEQVPEAALKASLGCGNPTALATLNVGETVLDLGSGGGIDVLLSARRVGPTGKAYGLDMTDEMLALAEKNRVEQGADDPNRVAVDGHIGADPPAPQRRADDGWTFAEQRQPSSGVPARPRPGRVPPGLAPALLPPGRWGRRAARGQ